MSLFVRFTLYAVAAVVALFVLAVLLKIVLVAAIVTAIALGGVVLFHNIRRWFAPSGAIVRRG